MSSFHLENKYVVILPYRLHRTEVCTYSYIRYNVSAFKIVNGNILDFILLATRSKINSYEQYELRLKVHCKNFIHSILMEATSHLIGSENQRSPSVIFLISFSKKIISELAGILYTNSLEIWMGGRGSSSFYFIEHPTDRY